MWKLFAEVNAMDPAQYPAALNVSITRKAADKAECTEAAKQTDYTW